VSLGKIVAPKQFELLHELVSKAKVMAFLVNPDNAVAKLDPTNVREAAQAKRVQLHVVEAKKDSEIDAAIASVIHRRAAALIVQVDPFLDGRRGKLAALAARHSIPAIAAYPEFAAAGGLISYGTSLTDAYRLEGKYVGRVLKGEKPADMPIQQSVKLELVINLKTAKALGLTVPPSVRLRADQIIE
jgi:putative ABC transport system substrate-binding protein